MTRLATAAVALVLLFASGCDIHAPAPTPPCLHRTCAGWETSAP